MIGFCDRQQDIGGTIAIEVSVNKAHNSRRLHRINNDLFFRGNNINGQIDHAFLIPSIHKYAINIILGKLII